MQPTSQEAKILLYILRKARLVLRYGCFTSREIQYTFLFLALPWEKKHWTLSSLWSATNQPESNTTTAHWKTLVSVKMPQLNRIRIDKVKEIQWAYHFNSAVCLTWAEHKAIIKHQKKIPKQKGTWYHCFSVKCW